MKHALLAPCADTLRMLDHMLLAPHVLSRLDRRFTGYWNVYCLFNLVMAGRMQVFGSFEEDTGRLLGLCWGEFEGRTWIAHTAYERHADAGAGILGCIEVMKRTHPECAAIACDLPEDNRAVRLTVKRIGFVREGASDTVWTGIDGRERGCERYVFHIYKDI